MLSYLKNRQKDDNFRWKNLILYQKILMTLPLPLDQFRFNIVLWILITAYWAAWIWNFIAFVPGCTKNDAEIMWYNNKSNYSFRLISSLLFFLLWISQFQYTTLIYLTLWEIYLTVITYVYLIFKKWHYLKTNRDKKKEMLKKEKEMLK